MSTTLRPRIFQIAVALSLAGALGAWAVLWAQPAQAVVTRATGLVKFQRGGGAWQSLRVGLQLRNGDRVQTGPQSRLVIRTPHAELRLGEKSEAALEEMMQQGAQSIQMQRGFGWFHVQPGEGRRFQVHTPTMVASVRGTRFAVAPGDNPAGGAISCVCEGQVATAPASDPDETELASAGDSNDYDADGDFSRRDLRQFFRKLKVDRSFQTLMDQDVRYRNCTSCHRMTDLATDHSPDPTSY
ncbi:MAG: FecR family protein [Leptospirales bacterium]|nr:FecR family protein [Leptospirales bacterium]